ncbi:hypothetical protein ACVPOW_12620 [Staphylococcus aureus]
MVVPICIALKDFSYDGVRFKREHLSEAASHLTLKPMPEAHKKVKQQIHLLKQMTNV